MSTRTLLASIVSFLASANFTGAAIASDGTLDTSFATTGETSVAITSDTSSSGAANAVASVANGKVIIAGTASIPAASATLAIARLLVDGTPDATFGNLSGQPGRSAFDLTAAGLTYFYYDGFAVMSGSSGTKYYLGGTSYINPNYVGVVLRVNDAGQLDPGFAGNGYALVDLSAGGAPHSLFARAVAAMPDGGVIVGGEDYTVSGTPSYLVRFLANGTQDTSFNGNAGHLYVDKPIGTQGIGIIDIKTDAAGNIFVAFRISPNAGGSRMALVHVTASGVLDAAFANNSTFAVVDYGFGPTSVGDMPAHIALQPGGKIVMTGEVDVSMAPGARCGIARFNSDGTPDATFGVGGREIYSPGPCKDIAIQGNRRIVAAGNIAGINGAPFALGLNIADGSFDPTFGSAGVANYSATTNAIAAMAIDGAQRPVLAGSSFTAPGFYAARLTAEVIYADGFEGN